MNMVKLYLMSRTHNFYAEGLYNPHNNHLFVLEGAKISAYPTLKVGKGKAKWLKMNTEYVKDGYLVQTLEFRTPSTAATFVSGTSMNGYARWKNENGKELRTIKESING